MIQWMAKNILPIFVLSPLFGIVLISLLPKRHRSASPVITVTSAIFTLALAYIVLSWQVGGVLSSFVLEWLPLIGSNFYLAMDNISLILTCAGAVFVLLATIAGWKKRSYFFILLLVLEIGYLGLVASRDVFFIYLFSEMVVISFGFIVMFERGEGEGLKYLGVISLSSAILLVVVAYIAGVTLGTGSSILEKAALPPKIGLYLFLLFAAAIFARLPLFPFGGLLNGSQEGQEVSVSAPAGPIGIVYASQVVLVYKMLPYFSVALNIFHRHILLVILVCMLASAISAVSVAGMKRALAGVMAFHIGLALLGISSFSRNAITAGVLELFVLIISTSVLSISLAYSGKKPSFSAPVLLAMSFLPSMGHFPPLLMLCLDLSKEGWYIVGILIAGVLLVASSIFLCMARGFACMGKAASGKQSSVPYIFLALVYIIFSLGVGLFPDWLTAFIGRQTEVLWQTLIQQL